MVIKTDEREFMLEFAAKVLSARIKEIQFICTATETSPVIKWQQINDVIIRE